PLHHREGPGDQGQDVGGDQQALAVTLRAPGPGIALMTILLAAGPGAASNEKTGRDPRGRDPTPAGGPREDDRAARERARADAGRSLTGSWGGWRSELEDTYGIFVVGNYTAEVAGNPVGGRSQGVEYTHNVGLGLIVDLEKFAGLPHTRFLASASNRAGSSLSKEDIGNV